MILSDRDILRAVKEGHIKISPFKKALVQSASVDLTLAPMVRTFEDGNGRCIDVREEQDFSKRVPIGQDGFVVHPGRFFLAASVEEIELTGSLVARIDGRSSLGRLGLLVHTSASYIAPGFSGNITLEISNLSRFSVRLYPGMRVAQISFQPLTSSVLRSYGIPGLGSKYQGQAGPTASRIWQDFEED